MKFADFYNNSFHIRNGPVEKLIGYTYAECFNGVEGDSFDCAHFYEITKCMKPHRGEAKEVIQAFAREIRKCKSLEKTYEQSLPGIIGCRARCLFSELNLSESDYFNTSIIKSWFEDNFPDRFSKFVNNKIDLCNNLVKLKEAEVPKFNCEYFYLYSTCWFFEGLRGLVNMVTETPLVKGFIYYD